MSGFGWWCPSTVPAQVAAHACATHETIQAAEVLASLPKAGAPRHTPRPGAGEGNVSGIFRDERDDFFFQRSFLQARAELLQLLGVSWGVCQVRIDSV